MPKNHTPEPWQVRPENLRDTPTTYYDETTGFTVTFQTWDIIGVDSPMRIAEVGFRANPDERVGTDWGPTQRMSEAIANRDRIVACVNACAGMADPAAEINQLRSRIEELENPPRSREACSIE